VAFVDPLEDGQFLFARFLNRFNVRILRIQDEIPKRLIYH